MGDMMMSGGPAMSSVWMRMPGQTWTGAAAAFLGMWMVMMAAMMLPSLIPMLWRYRQAVGRIGGTRLVGLMGLVSAGYFFVWGLLGVAVFPVGVALAQIEMRQPTFAQFSSFAAGVAVLIASVVQLTQWKAHRLAWCSEALGHALSADAGTAWRHGLCLGRHCAESCAPLMTIMLVMGIMDLRVMAVVTLAITVERLVPGGVRVARAIGSVGIAAGLSLIALAVRV
jgi:predicted metal-binding membrane protein